MMIISEETATKLIKGEFNTFEELLDFEIELVNVSTPEVEVLFKIVEDTKKQMQIYIIETLFINENH